MSLFNQGTSECDHGIDIMSGVRLQAWRQGIELSHVFPVLCSVFVGHRLNTAVALFRSGDNFIVYIGNIAGISHAAVLGLQQRKRVSNTTTGLALPICARL